MPNNDQKPAKKKALSPHQLGACIGAVIAILGAFVVRDFSRPAGNPNAEPQIKISGFVIGVIGGVGAVTGMAAALVQKLRGPKNEGDSEVAPPSADAGAENPSE